MDRRHFLQKMGLSTALIGAGQIPLQALSEAGTIRLTILHTNDVHSRIEPFPLDGGPNQGLGGAVRRASLVDRIRALEDYVLLLDCGDIFQGTPYFNYFGGELEFKLMSRMNYDAATIGNHDFDAGLDGLVKQLPNANFPFVISNYDFSDTEMAGRTRPYMIIERGPIKIGITGVGIELNGLVPTPLFGNTQYLDPIASANKYAAILKEDEGCDYVICLSHLGFKYEPSEQKVDDHDLAKQSTHIDLILGGHTHTFLRQPQLVANKQGQPVYINQAGWAGILLGRMDIYFERNSRRKCVSCQNIVIQ